MLNEVKHRTVRQRIFCGGSGAALNMTGRQMRNAEIETVNAVSCWAELRSLFEFSLHIPKIGEMLMTNGRRIVLFTGPAAAGKSTIAEAWSASRSTPTAHFDHDQARFLVRAGYISRSAAHADPSLREQADRQWLLAAAVCEAMAATYIAWGFDFALSAFRPPGSWKGCWERLDAMHPIIVVLLPALEVVLARDAERTGRSHVGEASVRRGLAYDWEAWRADPRAYVIDNSELSVEQVVALVEAEVVRRPTQGSYE